MKTKFTRISSILLAVMLLVAMVPVHAFALTNGGTGGSEAGELQWICVSGTHSWDEGEVTTAATCTGTGVRTFTCTLCGATKTENIPPLGHAYGEWTVTTEPTCGNPGERRRVCANDPTHVEVEVINATGVHVPGALVPGTAATCTEAGTLDHYVCQQCGANIDAEGNLIGNITVPATGHTVVNDAAVDPTCTETGLTAGSHCSVCGAVIVAQTVVPATGHTMEATAAVAATCTAAGNSAYWYCSECEKYFSDANGETEIAANSWIIPATGHTLVPTAAVAETCTTAGNSAYWTCSECGKYFSDENGETEIAANSWIIPAAGHTLVPTAAVAATCTAAGNSAYWTCSECGKYFSDANGETEIAANSWIIPATGHTWVAWQEGDDIADFTLKTAATTESAAVYYKNCSVDGVSAEGIDETATFTYGEPLPAESDIMYGDVDGDDDITLSDIILLSQYLAEDVTEDALSAGADVDGDESITLSDIILLSQYLAEDVTIDALGPQS